MYDEASRVIHVVEPLLLRAIRGIATTGVEPVKVLSIESLTSFLGEVLLKLKAGPIEVKDLGHYRSALQCGYMLKKFRYGGDPTSRSVRAIEGFKARNSALLEPRPDPWLERQIKVRMRRLLERALPVADHWRPKFGNGAVAEHVPWLGRWENIPKYPALHSQYIVPKAMALTLHGGESVRLCCVPKDYAKDRLITVEPWLNTFAQHATRRLVYESVHSGPLRGSAMDALHRAPEPIQRAYAVEGSKYGNYATFDLSDASDTMSLVDVEDVFPCWLLPHLLSCRTPNFVGQDGKPEGLVMYAGMGNATTFVVQTLYFWAACAAIAELSGIRRYTASVHGDDIVVDSTLAREIIKIRGFEALGLKINHAKSYWCDTSFRESCGIWALNGLNVTPTRFDGYDLYRLRGRIGFAEVARTMLSSGCGMQLMLADRLIKRASSVVKISHLNVPGTEFVFDKHNLWPTAHYDTITRLNKELQVLEVKAEMPQLRTVDVPADRVGYLYGALLGSVTTNVRRGRGSKPLDNGFRNDPVDHVVTIPVPSGEMKIKKRWVPIEGFPMGARSSMIR